MIDPATMDPDPWRQFATWLEEAESSADPMPGAFALATASADGTPSVRFVLLRGWDRTGLRFYTDRRSRKGRDIAANPRAAATFHWASLDRQLRVHGRAKPMDESESRAYFLTRSPRSRLSAWVSRQGEPIASRDELEKRVDAARTRGLEDRLPPDWGGYRLVPDAFEFWHSREDRLHDRVEYVPDARGGWARRRLQP
jgi:pyridoxamine 5'-phosphate oxidase